MKKKKRAGIKTLLKIMRRLRSEKGCPWDREQTHESLKKYLIEESAEFLDSVDDGDDEGMKEELGDVLLHIVFHSAIAEERGAFSFNDVVEDICGKMMRRHPHVFGKSKASNSKEVLKIWENIKKDEKKADGKSKSAVAGVRHYPALFRAHEIQKKAEKHGFDWRCKEEVVEKIEEELVELKAALKGGKRNEIEEELGDMLFSLVNLSRFLKGKTAEELLAATNAKFQERFMFIESELHKKGKTVGESNIDEMEKLWRRSKEKV